MATVKKKPEPEIVAHVGGDSAGYITYDVPESEDGVTLPFPRPFAVNPGSGDVLVVVPTTPDAAKAPLYVGVDRGPTDFFDVCLIGPVPAGTYGYAYHLRPAG